MSTIEQVFQGAQIWLDSRRARNARALFCASAPGPSLDALSLHIDLASMLGELDELEAGLLNQFSEHQNSEDGFFHEDGFDYTSGHPRVREMAGTYLGFQIGELLLRLNTRVGEFHFWAFLLEPGRTADYLDAMPWVRSPWGAGGWLDAICTMVRANIAWGFERYQLVFSDILYWIHRNQDPTTGTWGRADVQGAEGLANGAYHLLRGTLIACKMEVPRPKLLLDFLIEYIPTFPLFQAAQGEACHDLDAFYLLWYLHRQEPTYRVQEIHEICSRRLDHIFEFQNADGGFGFYPHESHHIHNYRKVGNRIYGDSDIQGTVFYLTAIKAILKILETASPIPWRFSLTHG